MVTDHDYATVAVLLRQYDALHTWTQTEGRWIEVQLGWTASKAKRVVAAVRRAAKQRGTGERTA